MGGLGFDVARSKTPPFKGPTMIEVDLTAQIDFGSSSSSLSADGNVPPYELVVDGFPVDHFRVHAFLGKEIVSQPYHFDVSVTASPDGDTIERSALHKPAHLVFNVGKAPRAFYGVISAVQVDPLGDFDGTLKYHLRLVPRMWLMKRVKRSRIYQIPAGARRRDLRARRDGNRRPVAAPEGISCAGVRHPVRREQLRLRAQAAGRGWDLLLLRARGAGRFLRFGCRFGRQHQSRSVASSALGSAATSAIGGVAGSAIGSVVGAVASEAQPLIPGDTVICGDDASFYPPLGPDDAGSLAAESAAALAPEAAQAVGDALGGMTPVVGAASAVAGGLISAFTARGHPPSTSSRCTRLPDRTSTRSRGSPSRTALSPTPPPFVTATSRSRRSALNSAAVSSHRFRSSPLEVAAAAAAEASNAMSALASGPRLPWGEAQGPAV